MPDREKVMDALMLCRYDPDPGQMDKYYASCMRCPYRQVSGTIREKNCAQMYTDAIALLKEQEPVKPIEEGSVQNRWFRCGKCAEPLYGPWNYCPKCGRAVKWDG